MADMLRAQAALQAGRAFVWLVVAFGAGIALFFTWKADPAAWLFAIPCVVGATFMVLPGRIYGARFMGLALIAFGLGHGAAQLRTWVVATPLLERDTRRIEITGLVTAAEKRPDSNRVILMPEAIPDIAPEMTPRRLRITIPTGHGSCRAWAMP